MAKLSSTDIYGDLYVDGIISGVLNGSNSLIVKLNSGTTEGTNQFTFNGSAAKTVNITPSAIGAAASSHNHTSLTGITSLAFATDSSDAGSISTTIDGTNTYFDFNLKDDPAQNDTWRWRFSPSGGTVFNAMTLDATSTTAAKLTVTGNVTATSFTENGTALSSKYAATSHTHNSITNQDTRAVNTTPDGAPLGLSVHLKTNGTDSLSDGGTYHSSLFIKGWNDYSGGPYGNIAISANNNLWYRASSSGTAWNSWKKVSVDGHTHNYAGSSSAGGAAKNSEKVGGYSVWVGTQAQYNALSSKSSTTLYYITG